MASFIDRNPDQMMRYGKDARDIIGEMTLLIRKTEGLLDSYAKDLDEPTVAQIQKLHECCSSFFREIEVYQKIADDVYFKGKKLGAVRAGG